MDEKYICDQDALKFTGKLYSFPDLSRKRVDKILAAAEKLFNRKLQSMQKNLANRLKNFECNN